MSDISSKAHDTNINNPCCSMFYPTQTAMVEVVVVQCIVPQLASSTQRWPQSSKQTCLAAIQAISGPQKVPKQKEKGMPCGQARSESSLWSTRASLWITGLAEYMKGRLVQRRSRGVTLGNPHGLLHRVGRLSSPPHCMLDPHAAGEWQGRRQPL